MKLILARNKRLRVSRKQKLKFVRTPFEKHAAETTFFLREYNIAAMRELNKRKSQYMDALYAEAFSNYVATHSIPARMRKISRKRVRIKISGKLIAALDKIAILAYQNERPISALLDEAVKAYLSLPENYLGKAFAEKHPYGYEILPESN